MGIQVRKVPVNLKLEGEAAPSDSAAVHYARSSQCNKSMHGIKVVTVQLNTRPQHIGDHDGVAGAGGAPGAWRPQPAPARRAGTMTWAEIS